MHIPRKINTKILYKSELGQREVKPIVSERPKSFYFDLPHSESSRFSATEVMSYDHTGKYVIALLAKLLNQQAAAIDKDLY